MKRLSDERWGKFDKGGLDDSICALENIAISGLFLELSPIHYHPSRIPITIPIFGVSGTFISPILTNGLWKKGKK